ncbi:MAG: putative acetyltransferase [Phenylobacterium sp.]|jgi:putative acetyltransferase
MTVMTVVIRHSEKEDIAAIKAMFSQPSCYGGTLQLPFPSLDKWTDKLGTIADNQTSLVAEIDGDIVGQLSLFVEKSPRRKHVANIGMAISDQHQGKGIGSQMLAAAVDMADNWLAIRRIELEVYADNAAGVALYKKHGFEIEGTAKCYAFRDGQYVDAYLMARLKGCDHSAHSSFTP